MKKILFFWPTKIKLLPLKGLLNGQASRLFSMGFNF